MDARNATRARVCVTLVLVALGAAEPAGAAAPASLSDDGNGKRWRQLTETTSLTPNEVAQVCPRGGKTRCSGSIGARDLTGWVWASAAQVQALLGRYLSDVTVTWDVADAESGVSTVGCGARRVATDTAGTTFTCEATSRGGAASRSVVVKRDATATTVTCMTPPQVSRSTSSAPGCARP